MEAGKGSRGRAPLILNLGTRWRGEWSASGPGRFTPRKELWYPLNRNLVGPQSFSGSFGEQKNLLTQDRQMLNGINIDTVLHSNMSHVGIFKKHRR